MKVKVKANAKGQAAEAKGQAAAQVVKANSLARKPRPRVFPPYLATGQEEWRHLKRQQWREVMAALERYAYGSAYTPEQAAHWHLTKLARQLQAALDAEGWVAW